MRNGFVWRDGQVTLAKQDAPLQIRWSRPLPENAVPSSVTVTRTTAGRYYIALLVEEDIAARPPAASETGIDLNVKELVLSTGKRFRPPAKLKTLEARKRRYQRACKRKVAAAKRAMGRDPKAPLPKGVRLPISNNLRKAHRKVGRVAERIANVRRDWQHKTTTAIVRENQVIAMEDLYVQGMTTNAKGSVDTPGKQVQQKAGLNRAILDVGFGEIRRQIQYKAQWSGRITVLIDRWYPSSKRCGACGHLHRDLRLGDRHWTCPECGTRHDRDLNAARNILAAGQGDPRGRRRATRACAVNTGGLPGMKACGAGAGGRPVIAGAEPSRAEAGKTDREIRPARTPLPGNPRLFTARRMSRTTLCRSA